MATKQETKPDGATALIDSIQGVEKSSLEAVRRFLDTVDGVFPDVGEDGPRRKIIDSAFKMVEDLVAASNELARGVARVTEEALNQRDDATRA
jgi:hypothetical protein